MDARAAARERRLYQRWLTLGGNHANVPVSSSTTSLVVTLSPPELDATYGVLATPNWLTTVSVSSKATTGFTLHFGTSAPSSATVDYAVFRVE